VTYIYKPIAEDIGSAFTMNLSKHLKVELKDDMNDPYSSYDFDWKRAEAEWSKTVLPCIGFGFSRAYKGTHLQHQPAEILLAIAFQRNVSAQPDLPAFKQASKWEKLYAKFRTLCRATAEAGLAFLNHNAE
jgi:hypothetical protein